MLARRTAGAEALAAAAARGAARRAGGRTARPRPAPRCSTRPARCSRASRCARPRATPAPAWSPPTPSRRAPATSASAPASSRWSCSRGRWPQVHHELDLVTTPAGDLVAMVHCNNGASELGAWAEVFGQFAAALGPPDRRRTTCSAPCCARRSTGDADGGGLLAYNYLSGEPITGLAEGRPLVVRTPDSRLTLANFVRDPGLRRVRHAEPRHARPRPPRASSSTRCSPTAACSGPPGWRSGCSPRPSARRSTVGRTAGEGGAWGIAVLAAYLRRRAPSRTSAPTSSTRVFGDARRRDVEAPDAGDVRGFDAFLERYSAGLAIERAAVEAVYATDEHRRTGDDDVPDRSVARRGRAHARGRRARCTPSCPAGGWSCGPRATSRSACSSTRRRARADDLFVIKPSGVTYDELTPESMVVCDLDGNLVDGDRAPVVGHRGARLRLPAHARGRRRRAHALDLRDRLGGARRADPVRADDDGRRVRRRRPGRPVRAHRRRLDRPRHRRDPARARAAPPCSCATTARSRSAATRAPRSRPP